MKPGGDDHPEQDPAEGSREVVDKDLAQQDEKSDKPRKEPGAAEQSEPGARS